MIQLKNMTVLDVLVQQSPQLQELERQARPGILALQERLQELERQARPGILALQERLQEPGEAGQTRNPRPTGAGNPLVARRPAVSHHNAAPRSDGAPAV